MPSYNGEKSIQSALFSALGQKYENMEFIVVDDWSIDTTREIISSLQKKDQRIRLIKNDINQWIAKTLNRGLSYTQGKYIAILDCDDTWIDKYKTQKQVSFLEQNPEIGLLWTNGIIKNNKEGYYHSNQPQTDEQLKNRILWRCPFMHSTIMYKRYIYDKIWGYPEDNKYCPDYAYRLKAGKEFKFANLQDYTLLYDTNNSNTCYTHQTEQRKEAVWLSFKYYKEYPNIIGWMKNIIVETISSYLSKHAPRTRKNIRRMLWKPEAIPLDIQAE